MNECPVCKKSIPAERIFCARHWFKVPKPLRDRIWDLYRSESGSERHRAAVFEAVAGFNTETA